MSSLFKMCDARSRQGSAYSVYFYPTRHVIPLRCYSLWDRSLHSWLPNLLLNC